MVAKTLASDAIRLYLQPSFEEIAVADESGPSLNVRIDEGGRTMQFGIITDGQLGAGIKVSAEELDKIIGGLAVIRSQMSPAVPTDLPLGAATHHAEATHYRVAFDPGSDQVMLALRNPGLGWVSFAMPLERLEDIAHQGRNAHEHLAAVYTDT